MFASGRPRVVPPADPPSPVHGLQSVCAHILGGHYGSKFQAARAVVAGDRDARGPGGRRAGCRSRHERRPVALLWRRRGQHEVFAARSDQRRQRRQSENRLDRGTRPTCRCKRTIARSARSPTETTPLAVGNTLYTSTSLAQVAAIDGQTGETMWVFNPEVYKAGRPTNLGFVHRGVAYWTDGGAGAAVHRPGTTPIYTPSTPRPASRFASFGEGGKVNLAKAIPLAVNARNYTMTSPPVICRDVVIVGSSDLRRSADTRKRRAATCRPSTCAPASRPGSSTPFRRKASSATTPGKTNRGNTPATPTSGR